ncbi:MAG: DUF3881 family protein [Lachnospiraceae bacterium]|nr:DUF3881 family protein [Lachnospiraceae bacterium]
MHQYLKAIGFDLKTKKELNALLSQVESHFTHQTLISYQENGDFCEFQKEFGSDIGISICGELNEKEQFDGEYYFPYFTGSGITTYAEVIVERKYEKEQYVGVCEDPNVGISLIFFLQNGIEYMRERQLGSVAGLNTSVTFSGLALSGCVLFPVQKDENQVRCEKEASDNRKMLLNAARSGDQTAIETLTLDDIDIYSKVSRRLMSEDIFSIVDTYFMPYGIECDLYAILGEILKVKVVENVVTKERLYQLEIETNELRFDVCVPVKDVMGEPTVGRRFKGNIWLQGYINF